MLTHIFTLEKSPFLAIIGGDLTTDKLYGIDTMLNFCEEIWILGKLAIYFLMCQRKTNKFLEGYAVSAQCRNAVNLILENASALGVKINLPFDLLL